VLILIGTLIDTGSPLFIQSRVGIYKNKFYLIKFRTMLIGTKSVASHLADKKSVTRYGSILRKTKLDEIPQLINVIKGDMSLVGPRPCLYSQLELIRERDKYNLYKYLPGITGEAQINNIDMSQPKTLARIENKMMQNLNTINYFKYLYRTVFKRNNYDAIK